MQLSSKKSQPSGICFKAEEKRGEVIRCTTELFRRIVKGDFLCVIGPPACGKTITMLQAACTAVSETKKKVLESSFCYSTPRLPIFIRAAELAQILAATSDANVQSLEELVQ